MPSSRIENHASIEDVKTDLAALRSDVTDLIAGLAERGEHKAEDIKDSAVELANRGRERANDAHDQLCDAVANRPLTSLMIAAGVGALASALLTRR